MEGATEQTAKRPVSSERITVSLIPQANAQLQDVVERTGMSKTDIVNRAITLYEFIEKELAEGGDIQLHRRSGETFLVKLL